MEQNGDNLSENLEDYLETILDLEKKNKVARAKDIADGMGVLRGTVTGALKSLAEKGLINYEPYSFVTLTAKGAAIAREISRRHKVIRDFLENVLMMEAEAADQNACRMEHAMDKGAIDRLVQFIDYIHNCPRTGGDWIQAFVEFSGEPVRPEAAQCRECMERCVERFQEERAPDGFPRSRK